MFANGSMICFWEELKGTPNPFIPGRREWRLISYGYPGSNVRSSMLIHKDTGDVRL